MMSLPLLGNISAGNGTDHLHSPNRSNQTSQLIKLTCTWIIIIVGLTGNSFVLTVVKIFHGMKTTTNYLLANVAAADMTTLLFTALHLVVRPKGSFPSGAVGSFLCKFVHTNTVTIVTLLVTVLTLALVAVERYHALVKPLKISRRLTNDNIAYVITGIWAVAIVMTAPLLISLDYRPNSRNICSPGDAFNTMRIYVFCLVANLTLIPFLAILFFYSQIIFGLYFSNTICSRSRGTQEEEGEKKRLVTLLLVLTVVFFVAFVPYGVVLILKFSGLTNKTPLDLQVIGRFKTAVQFLTLCNCSVNPLIYIFQSTNYRQGFKFIVKKMFCRDTGGDAVELRSRGSLRSV